MSKKDHRSETVPRPEISSDPRETLHGPPTNTGYAGVICGYPVGFNPMGPWVRGP